MPENKEKSNKGRLLIEDLPTVLQKTGHDLLNIKISHNGKIIESNLYDEILLGDDKFDPFQVLNMSDRIAAMGSFWGTVLADINEEIEDVEIGNSIINGNIKNEISIKIVFERKTSKPPSAAEISNIYDSYFLPTTSIKERIINQFRHLDENEREKIFKYYQYLTKSNKKLKELKRKKEKISIVREAWKEKGYMIKSHIDLLITMINHNLIKIPEQINVYENWR